MDRNDYRYFETDRILENLQIEEDVLEEARKLVSGGDAVLRSLDMGYLSGSRAYRADDSMSAVATGVIHPGASGEFQVQVVLRKDRMDQAACWDLKCRGLYYENVGRREICPHIAAILLLALDEIRSRNPGDATNAAGARFLDRFCRRTRKTGLRAVRADRGVTLEPRLEISDDVLAVSYRVGTGKLYQVSNIQSFFESVRISEPMRFGTRTEMTLDPGSFTEESVPIWDFLSQTAREEDTRSDRLLYGAPAAAMDAAGGRIYSGKSQALVGRTLDTFFDLVRERKIPYWDRRRGARAGEGSRRKGPKGQKGDSLICREGSFDPGFLLTDIDSAQGGFEGVLFTGRMGVVFDGAEYSYTFDRGLLTRIPDEQRQALLEIFGRSERSLSYRIGRRQLPLFYYDVLPRIREAFEVTDETSEEAQSLLPPELNLIFCLDREGDSVSCEPLAVYDGTEYPLAEADEIRKNSAENSTNLFRDYEKERKAGEVLREFFPSASETERFLAEGDDETFHLLEEGMDRLREMGEVRVTNSFRRLRVKPPARIQVDVALNGSHLDLSFVTEELDPDELLHLLDSYRLRKRYYRMRDGSFMDLSEQDADRLEEMMQALGVSPKEFVSGKMHIPAYRALYLDKMLEENSSLYTERDRRFRELIKSFKTIRDADYEVPLSLKPVLRKYQIEGYRWMRTLDQHGFGGILADEMGLGKTLQTIALILAYAEENPKGPRQPSLVVTPASLVFNWEEEIRRFAPGLRVLTVTGAKNERREIIGQAKNADVLITSYDLLKRDVPEYEGIEFRYQIIDEAQYIKNRDTAAARSVKVIRSRTRFALTGTPIENRLSELWSIFDFLMPGFLYTYPEFRDRFELPVSRDASDEAGELLRRMVAQFILRRRKADVLKELPDKIEEVRYAKLEGTQAKLYDAQVQKMLDIVDGTGEEDFRKNRFQILAELTRLRQICCDPALVFDGYDGPSAKRELACEMIQNAIGEGHRILLFSQFTTMLGLLEESLKKKGVDYYVLTGKTPKKERLRLVNDFNSGQVPVFLISLKAGGNGLNLTGADMVVHYDPWWNMAVQDQATDRAHRIGQTRTVTVWRLIAKGSIEEGILKMQEDKTRLSDRILSGDEIAAGTLDREELLYLLRQG